MARHVVVQAEPKEIAVETSSVDPLPNLNEQLLERMNRIARATQPQPEDVPSDVGQSTQEMMTRHFCDSPPEDDDDVCTQCMVMREGRKGHCPWDELELLKHGWADRQGHHWNRYEPMDELSMLKAGLVDAAGHHLHPPSEQQHRRIEVRPNDRLGTPGHIRFPSEQPTVISIPDEEAQLRSVASFIEVGQGVRTERLKDGAMLRTVRTNCARVTLLHHQQGIVYIEKTPNTTTLTLHRFPARGA